MSGTAAEQRAPRQISQWTLRLACGQAATSAAIPLNASVGAVATAELSHHASMAGTSVGIAMLASVSSLFVAGRVSDRHGRLPVLTAGLALLTLGAVICAFAIFSSSYPLLVLGTIVFGCGQGPSMMHRAAAADLYPIEQRAHGVGLVVSAGAIGSIIGPLLGSGLVLIAAALSIKEAAAPWFLVPLTAIVALILVRGIAVDPRDVARNLNQYFPGSPPEPEHGEPRSRRELLALKPARAAITAAALIQAAMVGVMGVTAVVLHRNGMSTAVVGLFISAHFLGMFGLAAPLGKLTDRLGRRRMILAGVVVTGIGAIGTSLLGSSIVILPFFFLLGLGWCASWVAGTTMLADITTPQERGRLTATNDQIVALCGATAVISAGFVLDRFGFPAVGLTLTALLVLGIIPMLRLKEPQIGVYAD
ncbi:MAG: MFS transporter [Actinobacteria bacterium]|nr:MFS transporter [Actinomycetota bacterium]